MSEICYVYILLSQTPTKFGALVRSITKTEYNHVSIAFDESLQQLYSFGRIYHNAPVIAGIVHEYIERFTLLTADYVKIRIIRVPVSEQDYRNGLHIVREIQEDSEYFYNLLSVLSHPLFHGFHTPKAFSCAEFAAYMLRSMNVHLDSSAPNWAITPMEIGYALDYPIIYEGNILSADCPLRSHGTSEEMDCYFAPISFPSMLSRSIAIILNLFLRKLHFIHHA